MTNNEMNEILEATIDKFGKDAQLIVALEELSELSNEIAKSLNGKNKRGTEGIIDECADVIICVNQVAKIFDVQKDVLERVNTKLHIVKEMVGNA